MTDTTSNTDAPRRGLARLAVPWYYVTRLLGAVMLLFGVFADNTPERGTIIITGAGLLGLDKVARSEPSKPPSSGGK